MDKIKFITTRGKLNETCYICMFMQIFLQGSHLAICETNNNELASSTTLQWSSTCLQKLH